MQEYIFKRLNSFIVSFPSPFAHSLVCLEIQIEVGSRWEGSQFFKNVAAFLKLIGRITLLISQTLSHLRFMNKFGARSSVQAF